MRLKFNRAEDVLHFRLGDETIIESETIAPDIVLDYNQQGQVIGLEYLNVSKYIPAQALTTLTFKLRIE